MINLEEVIENAEEVLLVRNKIIIPVLKINEHLIGSG